MDVFNRSFFDKTFVSYFFIDLSAVTAARSVEFRIKSKEFHMFKGDDDETRRNILHRHSTS